MLWPEAIENAAGVIEIETRDGAEGALTTTAAVPDTEFIDAVIVTVPQIVSELALDWTSPNGKKLLSIIEYS